MLIFGDAFALPHHVGNFNALRGPGSRLPNLPGHGVPAYLASGGGGGPGVGVEGVKDIFPSGNVGAVSTGGSGSFENPRSALFRDFPPGPEGPGTLPFHGRRWQRHGPELPGEVA